MTAPNVNPATIYLCTKNKKIKALVDFCDKHMIRFKIVPDFRGFLFKRVNIDFFDDVSNSFTTIYNKHVGNQEVVLKTASAVSSSKMEEIENKVKALTSKNVNLTNVVHQEIVGGFVLRVGDLQYNASFKDQLKKLEQEFLNISIQ